LCQKTRIKESGYCSICDDLKEEFEQKHEAVDEHSTFSRVEIDFKLLKECTEIRKPVFNIL
jgi:hypothetical protein